MATYAIGDIHGNLTCLTAILKSINPNKSDTVIFLGDYIDRGLFSSQVIETIISLKSQTNVITLRGNHEVMMLSSKYDYDCFNQWMGYGGFDTVASYEGDYNHKSWHRQVPNSHWRFLENTIPFFENEKFIFVHASVEGEKEMGEQSNEYLYWKSFDSISAPKSGKRVICGHTSQKDGEIKSNNFAICIDTWSLMMWLTCLNVDTFEYINANVQGETKIGNYEFKLYE